MCKWSMDWAGSCAEDRTLEMKAPSKPHVQTQALNQRFIAACTAKGAPSGEFCDIAKSNIQALACDMLNFRQHGLPGHKDACEGKAKLALQLIDVGIGMSEPICTKRVLSYLLAKVKRK